MHEVLSLILLLLLLKKNKYLKKVKSIIGYLFIHKNRIGYKMLTTLGHIDTHTRHLISKKKKKRHIS